MKVLMENWRKYLSQDSLLEAEFFDSPDEDKPGNDSIIIFNKEEKYDIAGNTHGGLSHTIKHYNEFEPSDVVSALNSAINKAKESDKFILRNLKTGAMISGEEAKNSNSANKNAMLNTFDLINDKIKNNIPLNPEEESLKVFIAPLDQKYQSLVDSYISEAQDVDQIQDASQIKQLLDAGQIISFSASYKGSPKKYVFNPKNTGLIALSDGKVATLFRIDKTGNSVEKVIRYFGRNVEIQNAALKQALEASVGKAQNNNPPQQQKKKQEPQQQQKKKPNIRAMTAGMYRGGKTLEQIQSQIEKSTGRRISIDNIKRMLGV